MTPSVCIIPIRRDSLLEIERVDGSEEDQGPGMQSESTFHGCESTTALRNISQSRNVVAIGPALACNPILPLPGKAAFSWPPYGTRPTLGLIPYTPLHIAGTRIEPPMSVPTPNTLPLIAMSAPSPPELPPGVRMLLSGLRVLPNTWFTESNAIKVCGILVLQYKTAPAFRRVITRVDRCDAGEKAREVMPTDVSRPGTAKLSLMEIGRPWSGPTGLPYCWRYLSRARARDMARGKKISVRQFV